MSTENTEETEETTTTTTTPEPTSTTVPGPETAERTFHGVSSPFHHINFEELTLRSFYNARYYDNTVGHEDDIYTITQPGTRTAANFWVANLSSITVRFQVYGANSTMNAYLRAFIYVPDSRDPLKDMRLRPYPWKELKGISATASLSAMTITAEPVKNSIVAVGVDVEKTTPGPVKYDLLFRGIEHRNSDAHAYHP